MWYKGIQVFIILDIFFSLFQKRPSLTLMNRRSPTWDGNKFCMIYNFRKCEYWMMKILFCRNNVEKILWQANISTSDIEQNKFTFEFQVWEGLPKKKMKFRLFPAPSLIDTCTAHTGNKEALKYYAIVLGGGVTKRITKDYRGRGQQKITEDHDHKGEGVGIPKN